ncbi:golgin subfamily A member 6-like protein 22 [Cottoperca gobio]|uniref:Zinc finger C2HC domain-containing protein 1C n=1 Tax=Cottoperca gobio TaxID=56716 RepID=A0A6J2S3K3_COTGO|nr:zinc finger C2HC domain-containing protein 1C [Cottoperca gobio]XP_029316572.1 zinc finger C2HC domain-containing protein 1C [Cottoperca gobio]XP_029316573.1 zinc finger C2HC domain-containing protein 1C [Cottoperca gobio]XP_029316574.1 zinc finger C2HC domain-containing protein 1C [Cottoperca gobio]XP_029316575.1 zinc finger C2HC domain-containing protein 1C [Cottoperca gobio]
MSEVMNTYTRRRHSPRGQHNIEGQRNSYQAHCGVVPGRREEGVDQPFPNKPVSHRRRLNPGKQDLLDLHDFEKITITKQPIGHLSPQENHLNGTGKITRSQHTRKDSLRQLSGELQMTRAIHAKELMLQEKLWSVEEKIRQKIQRDAATCDDQRSGEQRNNRGQAERGNIQTKTRLSEQQRREPLRREMMMQKRGQVDDKQFRRTQDQMSEDRMRFTHEEERAKWKIREIEVAQSQRKGPRGTQQIAVHGQEVSGEFYKSRGDNMREHTRRKGGEEKDNGIWRETGGKSRDGTVKAKEREQNTTSTGDKGWTRERKCKEMYISDDEQDMPQMSQQRTSHKAVTENHRGAGRKVSGGPLLPPVSRPSRSSRPEQGELRQEDSTDTGLQLLPCRICNRKFASERLQKHLQICKKVKQSHRQVFNSYVNRTKGSAIEEFYKTHSKSPEVLKKKNSRQSR